MEDQTPADEPIYFELADALALYAAIIGGTPSEASDQLRDQGALEGALGRPISYAHYERRPRGAGRGPCARDR